MKTALAYMSMLCFDAFVLAGTAYLIVVFGWSSWWMLLALLMCAGSNPTNIIQIGEKND